MLLAGSALYVYGTILVALRHLRELALARFWPCYLAPTYKIRSRELQTLYDCDQVHNTCVRARHKKDLND